MWVGSVEKKSVQVISIRFYIYNILQSLVEKKFDSLHKWLVCLFFLLHFMQTVYSITHEAYMTFFCLLNSGNNQHCRKYCLITVNHTKSAQCLFSERKQPKKKRYCIINWRHNQKHTKITKWKDFSKWKDAVNKIAARELKKRGQNSWLARSRSLEFAEGIFLAFEKPKPLNTQITQPESNGIMWGRLTDAAILCLTPISSNDSLEAVSRWS